MSARIAGLLFMLVCCTRHDASAQPVAAAADDTVAVPERAVTREAPAADDRLCDGCPRRRVGRAFAAATVVNVLYGVGNLVRGQETAKITPSTWVTNMKDGWEWDLDGFVVNQIGHPYQGNNYFTAGRANGLNFWESAGLTAFGSGTWEFFGETNQASLNDFINTTLGGVALGEMLHRVAWLVRDPRSSGKSRRWREIGAAAIDPLSGANRFLSGDATRVSERPADLVPTSLGGLVAVGALWRGENAKAVESTGSPFLEMNLAYGDMDSGRSRTPYEAFAVRFRVGGGATFSEARVRGRLLGQPLGSRRRAQLTISQAYDFVQNNAYEFGAQSVMVATTYSVSPTVQVSGWGGATVLGAVDSPGVGGLPEGAPPPGQGESVGPRYYDYGPGSLFGASVEIGQGRRATLRASYEAHHLFTLDGIRANHMLQEARLDLLGHVRGRLGVGASAEYFTRRSWYQDASARRVGVRSPQLRAYLAWRLQ